jgi:hypothetical protein
MMHLTLQDFTCRRGRRPSATEIVKRSGGGGKRRGSGSLRTFERQVRREGRRVDASVNAEKQEVRRTKGQEAGKTKMAKSISKNDEWRRMYTTGERNVRQNEKWSRANEIET